MSKTESFLIDSYGRKITYLRVSVTDRCNLRCLYCMPRKSFKWIPHDNILRFEEIVRLSSILVKMGIKKIRLTGGEPLVRKGFSNLVKELSTIKGLEKICLTTNGTLLSQYAQKLYEAGLRHINISIDSLNPKTYAQITGQDALKEVLTALDQVERLGFNPIKINCVVLKGINDKDVVDLAALSIKRPFQIRFIEFMSIGNNNSWTPDMFVSSEDTKRLIEEKLGSLSVVSKKTGRGPAQIFKLDGARGEIGFISPLSHHFCATCNRIRLTADGKLRLCLFSDKEWEVLSLLRDNVSDKELEEFFRKAIKAKPMEHFGDVIHVPTCRKNMSKIGG